MNVIIANKYKDLLSSIDIEVTKSLDGVFEVDDILNTFNNYYYDRMLLDITAIKDYTNFDVIQKLSINLDMNKVILILDDSPESGSQNYLSKLISLGIYNFTRNIEGINYLLDHPNSYRDVAHIHKVNDIQEAEPNNVVSNNVTNNVIIEEKRLHVIGIKNVTEHAGATTLTYMMTKLLERNYKVKAIEVGKRDFTYFNSENLLSTTVEELPKEILKNNSLDILLIDLNTYNDTDICNQVLYLVEPSILQLNKLTKRDKKIFEKLDGKKIILNKSFVSNKDEKVFEYESGTKIFANIPCVDDRTESKEVNDLIVRLGFSKNYVDRDSTGNSNKLFGLFKF